MKIYLYILFIFINIGESYCQTNCLVGFPLPEHNKKTLRGKKMIVYIDSLKSAVLRDTIKFNKEDLVVSDHHIKTNNPYSPIYFVGQYHYRLDVIDAELVKEFINEVLEIKKIKKIQILTEKSKNNEYYEKLPWIIIFTKKEVQMNYEIAGFKKNKGVSSNY